MVSKKQKTWCLYLYEVRLAAARPHALNDWSNGLDF
jgi:hypothetical protein